MESNFWEAYELHGKTAKYSPLTFAVEKQNYAVVETLIADGYDVDDFDGKGRLALLTAVRDDDFEMVRILFRLGASHCRAWNPFWIARSASMIDLLVELGADPLEVRLLNGAPIATSLHSIIFEDNFEETIPALIRHGLDVNWGIEENNTAIHEAIASHASGNVVACLMDNGAKIPFPASDCGILIYWLESTEPRRNDLIERVQKFMKEASN